MGVHTNGRSYELEGQRRAAGITANERVTRSISLSLTGWSLLRPTRAEELHDVGVAQREPKLAFRLKEVEPARGDALAVHRLDRHRRAVQRARAHLKARDYSVIAA